MNEVGAQTTEERLRAEIEALKRKLAQRSAERPPKTGPSTGALVVIAVVLVALVVAGFFAGYLPRQRRERVLAAESRAESQARPVVSVQAVKREAPHDNLVLPGNIQAVTEAPILARANGYIKQRFVDIGDHVAAGQVLAIIEAPELMQQIRQAQEAVDQANSNIQQAEAALQQGQANLTLARVTSERWQRLVVKGVVSKQENDTYFAQYQAQQANVHALEKAVAAARSNAGAAEANLGRLDELVRYLNVSAPFTGVITVRNVDVGALVNEGTTLLYRIAQAERLRIFLNVPQADSGSVRVGQKATIRLPDRPGMKFDGEVTRSSDALDPASRTLLTEVQVPNSSGLLLPGMYAQVDLLVPRKNAPLVIPGGALVVRSNGTQVAVVGADGVVHFTRIQLGRDFGDRLEVLGGLQDGDQVVMNPSDAVREGVKVKPVK